MRLCIPPYPGRSRGIIEGRYRSSSKSAKYTHCLYSGDVRILRHDMDNLHTDAPPVFPSKVRKLAIGGSRAASVFRMSWASRPPTMAQTGENSCTAVIVTDLGNGHQEVRLKHAGLLDLLNQTVRYRRDDLFVHICFGN